MLAAVGSAPPGKTKITQMNKTQAVAIVPIGVAHLPRLKGPGTNCFFPEVMRKAMGIAYDVYSPVTDALSFQRQLEVVERDKAINQPCHRRKRCLEETQQPDKHRRTHNEPH